MTHCHAFQRINLDRAANQKLEVDGELLVTKIPLAGPAKGTIPPISYGATDLDPTKIDQIPLDGAQGRSFDKGGASLYVVRNATVHTRRGLVTAGGYFFDDFLYHVHLPHLRGWTRGCGPTPDGGMVLPLFDPTDRRETAYHLLAGNIDNYFHWMIDIVARLHIDAAAAHCDEDRLCVLVPTPDQAYKLESFDLAFRGKSDVLACCEDTVVAVDRLIVTPDLSGSGFAFHPLVLQSFARMRANAGIESRPAHRRVYVSRRDSRRRPLLNEEEAIEIVAAAGFEIAELGELGVAEQIELFAEASHIVAPHGAGLTNIVFAPPGAALLELHSSAYVQWSFRHLAGLVGLSYGCLIGTPVEPRESWMHHQKWRIDASALRSALANPPFSRS
jgi:hypothetical protein